jgi:PAS domain S-box-containing protein
MSPAKSAELPVSDTQAFRDFFDRANQGFAITGLDTHWLHVNASLCRMLGYTEDELRQLTWVELTHPADQAPDLKQFRRLMDGEIDEYQLDKRFVRKDGSLLYARLTVSAKRDGTGDLRQINATLLDRGEEQRALDALRLSEDRFRLLADSTLDGIWDWDLVENSIWLSPSWKSQLGYGAAELENRFHTFEGLLHPDDRPRVMLHLRGFLADPADVWQDTFRMRHRDGSWRQIMARAIAVIEDASVVRLLGVHVDMTREGEAAEQLRAWGRELESVLRIRGRELAEREALYRNIADYTFDWELWSDADGELRYCSPSCRRVTGYPVDAFFRDPGLCDRIVHPDDQALWRRHQAELAVARSGEDEARSLGFRLIRADGHTRWVERIDYPMYTEDGEYAGIRASTRDVTEMREAQLELERQRDFVEAVLGTARALILVLSPQAEIVRISRFVREVTGWRADELIGRNWIDVCVPTEQREHVHEIFESAFHTSRTTGEVTEVLTKSGAIRQLRWYDELLEDDQGGESLLVAVGVDVTEQIAAERALHRLNEELEAKIIDRTRELEVAMAAMVQSEKLSSLGTLVAGMAHEINNPLMGLANYIDFARKHSEGQAREMLGKADVQIERIADILRNLLAYARPPSSDESAEPVDLVAAARGAMALIATDLRHEGIQLNDRLPADLPPVGGDAGSAQQVVLNLLINAKHALTEQAAAFDPGADTSRAARQIELAAGVVDARAGQDPRVWLEVRDNGPGVPEAIRSRIFDPFFTTKPRGTGTGLGLSVSDGIVRGSGGRLFLRCPEGGGAVFRIELPVSNRDGFA